MTECLPSIEMAPVRSALSDEAEFRELVEIFVEALPEKRQLFLALFDKAAFDELAVCAHQLKGAGGGYGFPGLTAASARLECACKARQADEISQSLCELVSYMGRVVV